MLDSFLALSRFSVRVMHALGSCLANACVPLGGPLCLVAQLDALQNRLSIQFLGEKGVDSGGLHKDWCLLLSRRICAPKTGMFVTSEQGFVDINPAFAAHSRAPEAYRLVGRFISKAMFDRQLVDMPLSRALVMRLMSRKPTLTDLIETDDQLVTGLSWVLNNSVEGVLDSTFTTARHTAVADEVVDAVLGASTEDHDDDGDDPTSPKPSEAAAATTASHASQDEEEEDLVPLLEGGEEKEVTDANKQEYVDLLVDWRTGGEYQQALDALKEGFFEVGLVSTIVGAG